MITYYIFGSLFFRIFGSTEYNSFIVYGFYILILIVGIILSKQKKKQIKRLGYVFIGIFILLVLDIIVFGIGLSTVKGPI